MFGTCVATGTTVSLVAGSGAKVAETDAVLDTVQVPVPEHGPFQPRNELPAAGVAVNEAAVPTGNAVAQVPGQSIPAGVEVTRPAPPPARVTSRCQEDAGGPLSGAAPGPTAPHATPKSPAMDASATRQEMANPPEARLSTGERSGTCRPAARPSGRRGVTSEIRRPPRGSRIA